MKEPRNSNVYIYTYIICAKTSATTTEGRKSPVMPQSCTPHVCMVVVSPIFLAEYFMYSGD